MSRVNIVKKVKIEGVWKLLSLPRNAKGNYDWNAFPQGLYLIEWYAGGKRRRESAGVTAAQALDAQSRKKHELEGRKLGVPGFEKAGEIAKKPSLHVAVKKYLEQIETLKKPNTHRKYEAISLCGSPIAAFWRKIKRGFRCLGPMAWRVRSDRWSTHARVGFGRNSTRGLDSIRVLWPECPPKISTDGTSLIIDRGCAVLADERIRA